MPALSRFALALFFIIAGAEILARRLAGWCLIALLLAVFPANIYAISTGMVIAGHSLPAWML